MENKNAVERNENKTAEINENQAIDYALIKSTVSKVLNSQNLTAGWRKQIQVSRKSNN